VLGVELELDGIIHLLSTDVTSLDEFLTIFLNSPYIQPHLLLPDSTVSIAISATSPFEGEVAEYR